MYGFPFHLSIVVGRFQTIHNGLIDMINKALLVANRTAVFIGSSQESRTEKNPFTYEERRDMLRDIYGDSIEIHPLPDIGVGNVASWGDYVFDKVVEACNEAPDVMVSGKEERRADWFDGEKGKGVALLYIPKTIDISATQMREWLLHREFESWKEYTPSELLERFDVMSGIVRGVQGNTETKSI